MKDLLYEMEKLERMRHHHTRRALPWTVPTPHHGTRQSPVRETKRPAALALDFFLGGFLRTQRESLDSC